MPVPAVHHIRRRATFRLLSKLLERTSAVPLGTLLRNTLPAEITTNLRLSEWVTVFGDAKVTTAFLDRLTHRCHILEIGNDRYRFKASSEIAKQKRKETPHLTTSCPRKQND